MTSRERWTALLEGRRPDRAPCDYWATAEVTRRLLLDLQCSNEAALWKALEIDKCIFLAPRHPRATEDTWHIPSVFSVWNVETTTIPYLDGLGSYEEAVNPPLAKASTPADIESFPWPKAEEWDASGMPAECDGWAGYPIVGASYEPFYLYSRLRGMDRALEDLMTNPELVEAAMQRIFDIHAGIVRNVLETCGDRIDFIYVAEDLGTQSSLLMSPRTFRQSIKPWLKKMIDLAHSYGAKAFHHDDGAILSLIPDLVEIGIDVLNPIQWRCRGMERETLAERFGSQIVFHGGVDNQQTMPFGSADDVKREVYDNLRIFRNCKGYIVSPCHNLQANTPTRNILAMYRAVHEFAG